MPEMVTPLEFLRDGRGRYVERVVSVPFRPEHINFMESDGKPAQVMPWSQTVHCGVLVPDKPVRIDLREGAVEPAPLLAHHFCIDLRAAEKYGIDPLCVSYVELPVLDYANASELMMRVFVRVRT